MAESKEANLTCLSMCYDAATMRRFVTGRPAWLAYLTSSKNPSKRFSGVGFPNNALFEFEERLFEALCCAHENGDSGTMVDAKKRLCPLSLGVVSQQMRQGDNRDF